MKEALVDLKPPSTMAMKRLGAAPQEGRQGRKGSILSREGWPSPSAVSWEAPSVRTTSAIASEEASEVRRKPLYLTMIPAAMMKFSRSQKRKKKTDSELAEEQPLGAEAKAAPETCGLGCIVLPCLQRLNNIRCFLALYCFLVLAQGTVFGLVDLSNANFHREYEVSSVEKMVLALTYDVSSGLTAVFIAYYGGKGHRTRWIASSSFLIGFGSFLFAVPFYNAKIRRSVLEMEDICQKNKDINFCPRTGTRFQVKYLFFFILGKMVQGIAGMPLYILGMTFVDDNVSTHSSGIYLGIGDASEILGYGLGYAIGAPHLRADNKTLVQSSSHYEPDKPLKWYATWWIDFLFVAAAAWSTFIPFLFFPRVLSGTEKVKAEKKKEATSIDTKLKDQDSEASIKDLFVSTWSLMKNPLFLCQAVSKAVEALIIIGASKFLPVYIENQFILTPRMATMLTGVILIPGGSIGHFLGGVIVSKLRLSCKGLMRFVMVTSIVSIICLSLVIFVHCDPDKFAGINENYDGTGEIGNLTAPCNAHCGCSAMIYFSVCGRDEVEYFSPCFAGCKRSKVLNREKAYYNCSCIKNGLLTSDIEGDFIDALPGKCDTKCYKLPLFFAFILSSIIFSCFSAIPLNLAIFRTVPGRLHSLALGLSYVIVRLLGTIPGPLIFEWTIRNSCTFRDTNRCGRRGRCWIYNKIKMATVWVGICFFCKLCTIILSCIGIHILRHLKKDSTDELSLNISDNNLTVV
ncbi:solute carrier organic anion transporter family member 6A1 [Perognathus longimembris pacificus]|uniref:solute carrier organic anion transporter family member 6A1 n=1 Tax=Perognathus longimembris pacificus TaxID=214514 RepID=UPI002019F6B1|nr:solute carrier organic anion transporter family member 6A1 [Perognathus longimembris pacificus]